MDKKFNPKKLEILNNPQRFKSIPPDYIWEKLNIPDCKVIVDIGAGTGLFSKAFSELMNNGKVYAADISDVMVNWMKDNLSDNQTNVFPMLMDENKISLDDKSADLVLMIALHHELDNPEASLVESKRILKSGGKVCIIDWKKKEMPMGPPFEIRCTEEDISRQLKSTGFKNILIDGSLEMFSFLWAEK